MADLISRSALLELFKNLRDEHETSCISYNALYEVILQQPTAYDVEAVVAELEMASYTESADDMNPYPPSKVVSLKKAISIVRGKE